MTRRTPALLAALTLGATGLAVSVATTYLVRHNAEVSRERIDQLAATVAADVGERMRRFEYGLRGARGAVVVAGAELDRRRFVAYSKTRDPAREFPGALGVGVIQQVSPSTEAEFVARMRAEDPSFTIRALQPHTNTRFVIRYIEPAERNLAAVGLDIASEPNRAEAARTALRTGLATLTRPLTLVQASGARSRGFLLLLPIYAPDSEEDPSTREASAFGWSYAPLLADEIVGDLANQRAYTLQLADSEDTAPFFTTVGRTTDLVGHVTVPCYGRQWRATIVASPEFIADLDLRSPFMLALEGGALSLVLAVMVFLFAHRTSRTRVLRAEVARRAAIVDCASDAIIGETLAGVVTDWNRGAERLFGYPASFAIGRNVAELIVDPEHRAEAIELRAVAQRGEVTSPFDSRRHDRDGKPIDVSITTAPITVDGQCIGISKSIRDVSEARGLQRTLANLNTTLERQVGDRTLELETVARDLRNIVDAMPSMIGYWGKDLKNRVANRAYSAWFGMEPEALRGRTMQELLGDELRTLNMPYVEAALRGEPQVFERQIPPRPGTSMRDGLTHYLPDVVDGEVRGFYVLIHDITEILKNRRELAQAQRDNQALNEAVRQHAIVSVTDLTGRIIDVSDSFCTIFQSTRAELVGRRHDVVASGVHPPEFWIDMWRTVSSGRGWRGEVCNRAKDGSLHWVDSVISPFLGSDGEVERYVSFGTDITASKHAEDALHSTSALLQSVLASASEIAIIATDLNGMITVFNRGAERMLGYAADELVQRSTAAQLHDAGEVGARAAELTALYGEPITGFRVFVHEPELHGAQTREWTYVRKDGGRVPISLTVTAMRDEMGTLFGYLGVANDVTRQKEHERELRVALHRAEKANHAKSQFLANMSHEIRTPMNAVIGLSYLLERTRLDGEQATFLKNIQVASASLLGIINDVLDLSKIEAAEMTLERVCFFPGDLAREVAAMMAGQAQARGLALAVEIARDVPLVVEGDALRLRQVITNLLSNALKFTEHGSVRLRVERPSGTHDTARLRFAVQDTGIGIAPEALGRLFTPFVQADASTTRRFGGTGLGLSLVKQLIGLMGGAISVSSTPGVGSEFAVEVELPISRAPGVLAVPRMPLTSLRGIRILVADDSAINLEVARRVLELEGATVRLATNGEEAVALLATDPTCVDVVLMDVHMPVLDGNDATRQIRGKLGLTKIPIIALTAGALSVEREQARAAGMTDFVSKPFDPRVLVDTVRHHLSLESLTKPVEAASPPVWPAIEGIDGDDVARRLVGDVSLFERLLWQMLDDFADRDTAAVVDLETQRQRMHRLKGISGTLGVRAVNDQAGRCERACQEGDGDRATAALLEIDCALATLKARVVATTFSNQAVPNLPAAVELDGRALQALRGSLAHADLTALEQFEGLTNPLRHALGASRFAVLRSHIERLEFEEAVRALATLAA